MSCFSLFPIVNRFSVSISLTFITFQALPTQFNRGLLNNVGYETARSIADYDCYIFHDVDLLPKYIHNYYSCPDGPMHFAARNMKYSFL